MARITTARRFARIYSYSSALLSTAQKKLGEKAQPELQLSQVEAAAPVLACRPLWDKPRVNRCGGSTRTAGSNPDRENALHLTASPGGRGELGRDRITGA